MAKAKVKIESGEIFAAKQEIKEEKVLHVDEKPNGEVKKVEESVAPKHAYRFTRNVRHNGQDFSKGDAVIASDEELSLLLRNGLISDAE